MSKWTKLRKNPGAFFRDSKPARLYRALMGSAAVPALVIAPHASPVPVVEDAPKSQAAASPEAFPTWFNPNAGDGFRMALQQAEAAGTPVFLYLPWIQDHTNALIAKLSNHAGYRVVPLDLFSGLEDDSVRREVSKFIRENPHLYRKMVARRLVPLRSRIKGMIFTFDWAPVMRVAANVCEELNVLRILIPHESVFASREKYYTDVTSGASVPVCDMILGWGALQRDIFVERGYPAERFIAMGAPKLDAYTNYQPSLTREQFHRLFGLSADRKTILFATQPLDSQLNQAEAREAQRRAISDVLDYCEAHNAQLIVRIPPSKDKVLNAALTKRLEASAFAAVDDANCYLVPPEEAIYHADITTSINSTMLFEAMLMGRPSFSMKYISFQQIWAEAGIPAVKDADALHAKLDKWLGDIAWKPDAKGMEWAANQLSNGAFDGKAAQRIGAFLCDIASGTLEATPRANPAERAMFGEAGDGIAVIGTHATESVEQGVQKYLLPMLGCGTRQSTRQGMKVIQQMPSVDMFVHWGISVNASKTTQQMMERLMGRPSLIIEDGFLRSVDIGLSGEPGLSIIMDDRTAYYDATRPSRLQLLLEEGEELTAEQRTRARKAMEKITKARVSKYNHAPDLPLKIGTQGRKKILLLDQRYGDQSVASGLADEKSFQRMLMDALTHYEDYDILVKQHPDAIKGGKSSYFNADMMRMAKHASHVYLIDYDINPHALFDQVEKVFVATSGMGFEALIAGKEVHCYGAPFYAGWGATVDHLEIPGRTRARDVEALFHFAYITLSRYYSPALGRRCSVEEVVDYIAAKRDGKPLPVEVEPRLQRVA